MFMAIALQFVSTGLTPFLFIGLFFALAYQILMFYRHRKEAGIVLFLTIPLISLSCIFYIGQLSLLVFPTLGLVFAFTAIFLYVEVLNASASGNVGDVYTGIKSKSAHFLAIIGSSILVSILYFPALAMMPRIETGVIDVLAAMSAVFVSLLLLGWIITRKN
jgi:hypothetical protein